VVVVEETTGGGVVVEICSVVVVVLVTLSGLLQPATKMVPVSSVKTVSNRRLGVILVMA